VSPVLLGSGRYQRHFPVRSEVLLARF
jgi:hypothetical protein